MTTTCQICGRAIRAKTGLIAHHGYKQPWLRNGDGHRTASCLGARFAPYEVSRDRIPDVKAVYEGHLAALETAERALLTDPPASFTVTQRDAWGAVRLTKVLERPEGFDPASPRRSYLPLAYDTEYHSRLRTLRGNVSMVRDAIAFLAERYAAWKPPTEKAA